MLVDSQIKALVENGVLQDAETGRIGPVSYDLRNQAFYTRDTMCEEIALSPGESAFVGAVESIMLPDHLCAQVLLKNSRIRQGLAIAAPLYFPGHCTRVFFRVTNVSGDEITLNAGHDIAQITFEQLDLAPDHAYEGEFSDEFDYKGLGRYVDVYGSEMRKIERKSEQLENMEQQIYGNVIAIMGVFVAIFSLVNVDLSWMSAKQPISSLVVLNLSIVGGMSALVGLISSALGSRGPKVIPWILATVSFVTAILLLAFVK